MSDEELISRIYEELLQVNHELSLPKKDNGKRLVVHKKYWQMESGKWKLKAQQDAVSRLPEEWKPTDAVNFLASKEIPNALQIDG